MKIVKSTLVGTICGFLVGLVLSFFVGFTSIMECGCDWVEAFLGCGDATCAGGTQKFTSNPAVLNCLLYATLIGAAVGLAYGIVKTIQENNSNLAAQRARNSEEAKAQRIQWKNEIQKAALKADESCKHNLDSFGPLVVARYEATDEMDKIMTELSKVAELQGKVATMADELAHDGGEQ